ncbi:hypothetical protein A3F34_01340 [Candidatus Roizmanbacteria bacterium RIFCSPHIGHO2_12_FULL_44_10]|uniref:Uncharacterized protein n=1 Tax=Candidatus Roizmanbacteria bacterium RIFCSPHIGHO2_12_FULL_44_10 TaxID=1802054 RepID=A0A1F7I7D1_9BACT|nr:MAG: hypothetical protein A3F34_01340 [Candidatus Roizmanbacteria bacterium RIFCSPHIGHO2_12_FULL_44_10]
MRDTGLYVRVEGKVKKEAQLIAHSLGISLSTIINAFLLELIRKRSVTFNTRTKGKKNKMSNLDIEDFVDDEEFLSSEKEQEKLRVRGG